MSLNCGDVRSRTSYNNRVLGYGSDMNIVVTFDLGRVTTHKPLQLPIPSYCGDVRSRTSYNLLMHH